MAKKIEGYCQRHDNQDYLDIGNTVFVNRTPCTGKDPLCTVVVHECKRERVFTEGEVRSFLMKIKADYHAIEDKEFLDTLAHDELSIDLDPS